MSPLNVPGKGKGFPKTERLSEKPVLEINIGSWNIRRGLQKRELEIIDLINTNDLTILFLVETDSYQINEKKDFELVGFETLFHKKKISTDKTRLICLTKANVNSNNIKIREDLMSDSFPSIWIEITNANLNQSRLVCGFYREWSNDGLLSTEAQLKLYVLEMTAQSVRDKMH